MYPLTYRTGTHTGLAPEGRGTHTKLASEGRGILNSLHNSSLRSLPRIEGAGERNKSYSHPVRDEYLFSSSIQSISDSRHVTCTINKPTPATVAMITAHWRQLRLLTIRSYVKSTAVVIHCDQLLTGREYVRMESSKMCSPNDNCVVRQRKMCTFITRGQNICHIGKQQYAFWPL